LGGDLAWRGVVAQIGVQPEVKRFGKYKSAGDQLMRTDMSGERARARHSLCRGPAGAMGAGGVPVAVKTVRSIRRRMRMWR
jgi:hypothetical protein